MKLPNDLTAYAVDGLLPRLLTPADVPAMLALQAEVLEALPDQRWYYPSDDEEFRQVVSACEGVAYFDGDTLLGFAELTPGELRGSHSYAASLKQPVNGSFDFHDVMVRPSARGRGMHTAFLRLFRDLAADAGGYAVYATVDPENGPSRRNFERAGYQCMVEKPAYDGRARRFYRLLLSSPEKE